MKTEKQILWETDADMFCLYMAQQEMMREQEILIKNLQSQHDKELSRLWQNYTDDLRKLEEENEHLRTILGEETNRLENEVEKWKLYAETQESIFEIAMQHYSEAETEIEKLKNDISSLHNDLDAEKMVSRCIIDDLKQQKIKLEWELEMAWDSAIYWIHAWEEDFGK